MTTLSREMETAADRLKDQMILLEDVMDSDEFAAFQAAAVRKLSDYRRLLEDAHFDGPLLDSLLVAYASNLNMQK